jgi:hypothetical protein
VYVGEMAIDSDRIEEIVRIAIAVTDLREFFKIGDILNAFVNVRAK